MIFVLFFISRAEEVVVKVKRKYAHLEIFNRLTGSLNINNNEEVNLKACKIFLVGNQGGMGGIGIVGAT